MIKKKAIGGKWVFKTKFNLDVWKVFHLDVKSGFLNRTIFENIFVQQLEGFEIKGQKNKVYKLHKAFYGLKQAPKARYSKIDPHLTGSSKNEPTLYLKRGL